jgi:hypothetical protein
VCLLLLFFVVSSLAFGDTRNYRQRDRHRHTYRDTRAEIEDHFVSICKFQYEKRWPRGSGSWWSEVV